MFGELTSRVAILRPLALRDFRLFWTGLAVSLIGDGIYIITVAWQALEINNSPSAIAFIGAAWMAPQVATLLVGGVLADRYDRRKLMILADLIRLAALASLSVLAFSGNLEIWHMVLLSALYGFGDALFGPAFGAYVPQLVPRNLLVSANALDQLVRPLALYMLGPALGGFLFASGGAGFAFAVDAGTFVVSALALVAVRTSGKPPTTDRVTIKGAVKDMKEGFAFVRSQRWLWATLLTAAITLFAYWGPLEILVPFLIKNELNAGAAGYGAVLAAGGVGAVIMAVLMAAIGMPRRFMTVLYISWGIACGLIGLLALATDIWHAMLVLFVSEGAYAVGTIIWITTIQSYVPDRLRGRVTSFDWFVSVSLMPFSFMLVAPISEAIGVETTLIAGGVLAAVAAFLVLLIPRSREIEQRTPPPETTVQQPDSPAKVPIPLPTPPSAWIPKK